RVRGRRGSTRRPRARADVYLGTIGRHVTSRVRRCDATTAGTPLMKIAIDARELQGQPTGVGRYLSALLAAWKDMPEAQAHEFVLCAPRPADSRGFAWEQIALPRLVRDINAQVLFSPGYTTPIFCSIP